MTDHSEQLVRNVALTLAERDVSAPELSELCQGTLEPVQLVKLRDEAARDPELAAAVEVHEPLSNELREQIVERLLRELPSSRAGAPGASPEAGVATDGVPGRSPSRVRRLILVATPLLAAAAVLPLLLGRGVQPIVHYSVEVEPIRSETRADPAGTALPLRPRAGQQVEVILRPDTAVSGPIRALAVLVDAASSPVPVPQSVEVSGTGALRMRLSWPGGVGRGRLILLVGRPERVSLERTLVPGAAGEGWQRFELPFETSELR